MGVETDHDIFWEVWPNGDCASINRKNKIKETPTWAIFKCSKIDGSTIHKMGEVCNDLFNMHDSLHHFRRSVEIFLFPSNDCSVSWDPSARCSVFFLSLLCKSSSRHLKKRSVGCYDRGYAPSCIRPNPQNAQREWKQQTLGDDDVSMQVHWLL